MNKIAANTFAFLFALLSVLMSSGQEFQSYSRDTLMMGSAFTFTAVHNDLSICKKATYSAIEEVARIEALISSWQSSSQTYLINQNAGLKAVKVDQELFDLISRSLKISDLTNGYFDISFASIDRLWKFDGGTQDLPKPQDLESSVANINYQHIILNPDSLTVLLQNKGMKIGFGAIGKGYAADQAKLIMLEMGVGNGVVNAGGDVLTWGKKENGDDWSIGITNPDNKNSILSTINISDKAVVTSGDYERFVIINNERYGHIINPKTGMPAKGVQSVSVLAESAELADAMATSIFVLGVEEGLRLANHLNGLECIIINDENKLLYSDGVSLNFLMNEDN